MLPWLYKPSSNSLAPSPSPLALPQVKKTAYAQSSQIRQIRKKMVEIMTREATSCDLKVR